MKLAQTEKQSKIMDLNDVQPLHSDIQSFTSAVMAHKWMGEAGGENIVSANELTSISALVAYVAHKSGDSEFRVERRVADRFNIPNVKCLPASKFDDAIRYLVDQVPAATAAD